MNKFQKEKLKENVHRLAKERGIPLAKMERDLGFSEKYLLKLDQYNPSVEKVVAMADYLHVSVDELVGYEGDYNKDLQHLMEMASWLTEEQLVALLAVAEQLKGK